MTKFRLISLAATTAVLTLLMSVPAGADDWRHDDEATLGFSLGSPYYHHAYPVDRPYRSAYQAAPRRVYPGATTAHVNWCLNRYRSYRASDNSFRPYQGPRRECRSPYLG